MPVKISLALQTSIEELLATPRGRYKHIPSRDLSPVARGTKGSVHVYELLPDLFIWRDHSQGRRRKI